LRLRAFAERRVPGGARKPTLCSRDGERAGQNESSAQAQACAAACKPAKRAGGYGRQRMAIGSERLMGLATAAV